MVKLNSYTLSPGNLLKSLQAMDHSKFIVAKYSATKETVNNWGDAVNVNLLEYLSKGKQVININKLAYYTGDVFSLIGSILDNNAVHNLVVCGSGFKKYNSSVKIAPKKVVSVRGPLSMETFNKLGIKCPPLFGDPALLFRDIYNPQVAPSHEIGIIPHYVDQSNEHVVRLCRDHGVRMIDIQAGIEEVIRQVKSCRFIVSSSLHGLILADMYKVPSVWIKISDKIHGDDFKFHDYFASVNELRPKCFQLDKTLQPSQITGEAGIRSVDHLIAALNATLPPVFQQS
jgi:pyruvyltransferase